MMSKRHFSQQAAMRLTIWLCLTFLLIAPVGKLYSYSFQYETLLLLDISAGASNFATSDENETPDTFAFSEQFGLSRSEFMPQFNIDALLVIRNSYLLRIQAIANNLRSQQSNFAFGFGNENVGLLFGVAQGFNFASQSRPNTLGFGIFTKVFYNAQGVTDLQFESVLLTNTMSNTDSAGFLNLHLYLQALFMVSQLRIGVTSTIDSFYAVATGPATFQVQGNLVFGGSAPARLFLLDLYLSGAAIIVNQRLLVGNNYSLLSLGVGLKFQFSLHRRTIVGLYLELMPFGISLNKISTVETTSLGLTFGLTMKFRISRKELWRPEVIPRYFQPGAEN